LLLFFEKVNIVRIGAAGRFYRADFFHTEFLGRTNAMGRNSYAKKTPRVYRLNFSSIIFD
jgi:hypothetical protein